MKDTKVGTGDPEFRRVQALSKTQKPVLITGGAGFVGTNLALKLLEQGEDIILYDNLSRAGVEQNALWLKKEFGSRVQLVIADIRDRTTIKRCVGRAGAVYHFAAQVAVTSSLADPNEDFEINLHGTLNLLEELRRLELPPLLVYTSTNKVYGGLEDLELKRHADRYIPANNLSSSVSETRQLDFHSPYGCSKGAADQYVIDYSRTFHIPAIVFRMSCIYGPHQFGTEDQGWVAHFLIAALEGRPITIYGDGLQVRDILYVEDLVQAFLLARAKRDVLLGKAFNIGGGEANSLSLRELLNLMQNMLGMQPEIRFEGWRPGDQKYYVSDCKKFRTCTGWEPQTGIKQGIESLFKWLHESRTRSGSCDSVVQTPTRNTPAGF